MRHKLATCLFSLAFLGAAPPSFPQLMSASLSSELRSDDLALRLGLSRGFSRLYLGLDADDEGSRLRLALSLLGAQGASFLAGPGSVAGSLRLLCDPTSPSSLRRAPPLDIDSSLESRRAVLGLDCGELSLFAAAEDEGFGAACGGIALGLPGPGLDAQVLAAASFAEDSGASSSWRAESASSRALCVSEGGLPIGEAALLLERRTEKGRGLAAVVGSYGRLAGPGLAFRLEARELAGPLDLRLCAGGSSLGFRALFGERLERQLGAIAEARLELYEDSSLTLKAETESIGRGCYYAPLWGGEASLALVLPLGLTGGFSVDTGLSGELSPEGEGKGSSSLALKRRIRSPANAEARETASLRADLGLSSGQDGLGIIDGLNLGYQTELEWRKGSPALRLDLNLELFEKGLSASSVIAKAAMSIALPFGKDGSLELEAALPESGLVLEPLIKSAGSTSSTAPRAQVPVFSLRYRARALF